jgi:hypothetical protein
MKQIGWRFKDAAGAQQEAYCSQLPGYAQTDIQPIYDTEGGLRRLFGSWWASGGRASVEAARELGRGAWIIWSAGRASATADEFEAWWLANSHRFTGPLCSPVFIAEKAWHAARAVKPAPGQQS